MRQVVLSVVTPVFGPPAAKNVAVQRLMVQQGPTDFNRERCGQEATPKGLVAQDRLYLRQVNSANARAKTASPTPPKPDTVRVLRLSCFPGRGLQLLAIDRKSVV